MSVLCKIYSWEFIWKKKIVKSGENKWKKCNSCETAKKQRVVGR